MNGDMLPSYYMHQFVLNRSANDLLLEQQTPRDFDEISQDPVTSDDPNGADNSGMMTLTQSLTNSVWNNLHKTAYMDQNRIQTSVELKDGSAASFSNGDLIQGLVYLKNSTEMSISFEMFVVSFEGDLFVKTDPFQNSTVNKKFLKMVDFEASGALSQKTPRRFHKTTKIEKDTTAGNGKTTCQNSDVSLVHGLPEDKIIRPKTTYAIPFTFRVPEWQVLEQSCVSCLDSHLELPPTSGTRHMANRYVNGLSEPRLYDDLNSRNWYSVGYSVNARLFHVSAPKQDMEPTAIIRSHAARHVRIIPSAGHGPVSPDFKLQAEDQLQSFLDHAKTRIQHIQESSLSPRRKSDSPLSEETMLTLKQRQMYSPYVSSLTEQLNCLRLDHNDSKHQLDTSGLSLQSGQDDASRRAGCPSCEKLIQLVETRDHNHFKDKPRYMPRLKGVKKKKRERLRQSPSAASSSASLSSSDGKIPLVHWDTVDDSGLLRLLDRTRSVGPNPTFTVNYHLMKKREKSSFLSSRLFGDSWGLKKSHSVDSDDISTSSRSSMSSSPFSSEHLSPSTSASSLDFLTTPKLTASVNDLKVDKTDTGWQVSLRLDLELMLSDPSLLASLKPKSHDFYKLSLYCLDVSSPHSIPVDISPLWFPHPTAPDAVSMKIRHHFKKLLTNYETAARNDAELQDVHLKNSLSSLSELRPEMKRIDDNVIRWHRRSHGLLDVQTPWIDRRYAQSRPLAMETDLNSFNSVPSSTASSSSASISSDGSTSLEGQQWIKSSSIKFELINDQIASSVNNNSSFQSEEKTKVISLLPSFQTCLASRSYFVRIWLRPFESDQFQAAKDLGHGLEVCEDSWIDIPLKLQY
ncbi:unnamed protein product [Kuraishia capsulata CBS 1993]|uniref:Uncharacterized protein n=1 Tax=Kuraishia capsulata CBS 1993 TaxID=1382522 RepID=W6MT67_9ASCO|nr:uncharacterized protein KUCA_T00004384001 [Kuraishia capsulata CBS 1993]CDK28402.1 unnamed protein product [Kuraishia capsulata CBS 1993]